jgi:hypothetical protein
MKKYILMTIFTAAILIAGCYSITDTDMEGRSGTGDKKVEVYTLRLVGFYPHEDNNPPTPLSWGIMSDDKASAFKEWEKAMEEWERIWGSQPGRRIPPPEPRFIRLQQPLSSE